jgi:AraC-like DNA-binding protein
MTAPEPVLQALDYVEANLQTAIQVADIANAAGYSLYHFCRMFGKLTRHTPYDYLIRRRMTLATGEVILSERKLLDIALDYQFESHEGFTRAFTRMCAVTPAEARRQQAVPVQSRLPRLSAAHLVKLEQQGGLMPVFESVRIAAPLKHSLAEIETELRAGQPVQLAISPTWPEAASPAPPGLFAGSAAGFTLLPPLEGLNLVLDWILHVWLFYAEYQLRTPSILFQPTANAFIQLWVPVCPRRP